MQIEKLNGSCDDCHGVESSLCRSAEPSVREQIMKHTTTLGIQNRKLTREFIEWCGYIPSFNVSVGLSYLHSTFP